MIELNDAGKCFYLRPEGEGGIKRALLSGLKGLRPSPDRMFWALRHIHLRIKPGESVGLIGPNGCGKSTLLRVIAGITPLSEGTLTVQGRVAGLIELTAGFNDELTGLENLYLNGAALGLSRETVTQLLPQICEFAGIGRFIDEPVRCYSAGMLLRLGFALAVHSQPDILVVDEALAVGDAGFQRKCMNQIRKMQAEGVTLLFVSHATEMVEEVCEKTVWLDNGEIRQVGPTGEVLQEYNRAVFAKLREVGQRAYDLQTVGIVSGGRYGDGTGRVLIEDVQLTGEDGQVRSYYRTGETAILRVNVRNHTEENIDAALGWNINIVSSGPVSKMFSDDVGVIYSLRPGTNLLECVFRELPLKTNAYVISVGIVKPGCRDAPDEIYDSYVNFVRLFVVEEGVPPGSGMINIDCTSEIVRAD